MSQYSFASKPILFADTECYLNYWCFRGVTEQGMRFDFELRENGAPIDVQRLLAVLYSHTVVTFNGIKYDQVMIAAACLGWRNADLKRLNDAIIVGGLKHWDAYKMMRIDWPAYDHIDLIEPMPGVRISQKVYAGRMHSRKMQDLPIDPSQRLTELQIDAIFEYCGNDLANLQDAFNHCRERLELRQAINEEFGVDVRSKSDAQAAEAVVKQQLLPTRIEIPYWPHGSSFRYTPPAWLAFESAHLQTMLTELCELDFVVTDEETALEETDPDGKPWRTGINMPKALKLYKIKIGKASYKMGIGGLHSMESQRYVVSDADYELEDIDVVSYYPETIIKNNQYPPQIGPDFLRIFVGLKESRVAAKRMLKQFAKGTPEYKYWDTKQGGYKIMINGLFGKTGSRYSIMYHPPMLIFTTITGQLALLMLIDWFENRGIEVVSANTDGIVTRCHRSLLATRDQIKKHWEYVTGYELEAVQYRGLFSRDVNNYIAVPMTGTPKTKGAYTKAGLMRNPQCEICIDAVVDYLCKGVPPADTIRAGQDIRKFVSVRKVAGGAVKDGYYLGSAVRWYYSRLVKGAITYAKNGNMVPDTQGARPLMELVDYVPSDVDYDWYIRRSYSMLNDLGLWR